MSTLRRLALVSLTTLAVGCAATTEDASSAQEGELVAAPTVLGVTATTLSLTLHGSGEMPAGAECSDASESYYVMFSAPATLVVSGCAGTPLRASRSQLRLNEDQVRAIIASTQSLQVSEDQTCDPNPAGAASLSIASGTSIGAAPSALYTDAANACTSTWSKHVRGLDPLTGVLRSIASTTPGLLQNGYPRRDTTAPIVSPFRADTTIVGINVAGSGDTPIGSSCQRGQRSYSLTQNGESLTLDMVTGCRVHSSGRLVSSRLNMQPLTPEQTARLRTALGRLRPAFPIGCAEGTAFTKAVFLSTDADGQSVSKNFIAKENACNIPSDTAFLGGLDAVRAVLEEAVQPTP